MTKQSTQSSKNTPTNKQQELLEFLSGHVCLPNTTLTLTPDGTILIATPEITTTCSIFNFVDNTAIKEFYELCYALGELKVALKIPPVSPEITYTTFQIDQLTVDTPEDQELYNFVMGLGDYARVNTFKEKGVITPFPKETSLR